MLGTSLVSNFVHNLFGARVDFTEALPLSDVEYIGCGDLVRYERLNEQGEIVMWVDGVVENVNYQTQKVQLFVGDTLRFWVEVEYVSLVLSALPLQNVTAAVVAEALTATV